MGREDRKRQLSARPVDSRLYSEELLLRFGSPEEYAEFIRSSGEAVRPRIARALHLADLRPGMRVLDVGCGKGEVAVQAALAGAEVYGLDYSDGSLNLSRRTLQILPEDARKRAALIQADARSIPFGDESFDRIFILDLIEHLHDWELRTALRELHRLLKPGGYVVIHTLPNRWALQIGYPLARLIFRSLPSSPRNEYERAVHVSEQDIVGLHALLRQAEFAARVWLEGRTRDQAVWQGGGERFCDVRNKAYSILSNQLFGGIYSMLLRLPARLLLGNDIYAIAWRADAARPGIIGRRCPRAWAEKVCISIGRLLKRRKDRAWRF